MHVSGQHDIIRPAAAKSGQTATQIRFASANDQALLLAMPAHES
jgi:hypothetical protein